MLKYLPMILRGDSCMLKGKNFKNVEEYKESVCKLETHFEESRKQILQAYLDILCTYCHQINGSLPREYLDSLPLVAIGYLANRFPDFLVDQTLLKLLKILGNSKTVNYLPETLDFLDSHSEELLSKFHGSDRDKIELYESWPSIFLCKV